MENRREFIKKGALLTALGFAATKISNALDLGEKVSEKNFGLQDKTGIFTLPELPYKYEALEPHIDLQTMQIHHDKHHKTYVDNLNKAISNLSIDTTPTIESLLQNVSTYPASVRNNGGGHYNHSMFWQLMRPEGGGVPKGKFSEAINASFGSFEDFKKKFNEAGATRFGSGWAWLVKQNDKLVICSSPNQDNPLMDLAEVKGTPVICLDVWEHAYYLKYQNKRADYMAAWWNVINWDEAAKRLG